MYLCAVWNQTNQTSLEYQDLNQKYLDLTNCSETFRSFLDIWGVVQLDSVI